MEVYLNALYLYFLNNKVDFFLPLFAFIVLLFSHKIYKGDKDKIKSTRYISLILMGLPFVNYSIVKFGFVENQSAGIEIVNIIFEGLFLYVILSVVINKYFGTPVRKFKLIRDRAEILELKKLYKDIDESKKRDKYVEISKGKAYNTYRKMFVNFYFAKEGNIRTQIYNVFLFCFVLTGIIVLIYPLLVKILVIDPNSKDAFLGIIAFLGIYVFRDFFPDLYYIITFSSDKGIDINHYVSFNEDGKEVFGKIIEVGYSYKKVHSNYLRKTYKLPHSFFKNRGIGIYSEEDGRMFKKTYVVDVEIIDEVKSLIKQTVEEFGQYENPKYNNSNSDNKEEKFIDNGLIDLNSISIQETDANYGIKVKLKLFIMKLEQYGNLTDEIEDLISKKIRNTEGLSLETHDKGELKLIKKVIKEKSEEK